MAGDVASGHGVRRAPQFELSGRTQSPYSREPPPEYLDRSSRWRWPLTPNRYTLATSDEPKCAQFSEPLMYPPHHVGPHRTDLRTPRREGPHQLRIGGSRLGADNGSTTFTLNQPLLMQRARPALERDVGDSLTRFHQTSRTSLSAFTPNAAPGMRWAGTVGRNLRNPGIDSA